MKAYFRQLVCRQLEKRVIYLRQQHDFRVIAVAGSVGKTSTKMAVAKLLEACGKKVRYQEGNYNDRVTVPLVFFDEELPSLFNIYAWWRTFRRIDQVLKADYSLDFVVVELGTDGPGQLQDFAYIEPEVSVVTAVAPEHMLQFGDIDAVAREELSVAEYSKQLLINTADVDKKYLEGLEYQSYAVEQAADYQALIAKVDGIRGQELQIKSSGMADFHVKTRFSGKQGAAITLSAVAVALQQGLSTQEIQAATKQLEPFAGRLQILEGINGSTIIDDTYNSSPLATKAALDLLYATDAQQKIAILGDMNELGDSSVQEHRDLGMYCRADQLDYVVTIGTKSRDDLAPAAKDVGCQVKSFTNPVDAGNFVKDIVVSGAVILAKGSQNGVFSEEAVKQLLRNSGDASKLVRQGEGWMGKKA